MLGRLLELVHSSGFELQKLGLWSHTDYRLPGLAMRRLATKLEGDYTGFELCAHLHHGNDGQGGPHWHRHNHPMAVISVPDDQYRGMTRATYTLYVGRVEILRPPKAVQHESLPSVEKERYHQIAKVTSQTGICYEHTDEYAAHAVVSTGTHYSLMLRCEPETYKGAESLNPTLWDVDSYEIVRSQVFRLFAKWDADSAEGSIVSSE